jgi:hypothetical protein
MHWNANSQGGFVHSERARDDPARFGIHASTEDTKLPDFRNHRYNLWCNRWFYVLLTVPLALCLNSPVFVKRKQINFTYSQNYNRMFLTR